MTVFPNIISFDVLDHWCLDIVHSALVDEKSPELAAMSVEEIETSNLRDEGYLQILSWLSTEEGCDEISLQKKYEFAKDILSKLQLPKNKQIGERYFQRITRIFMEVTTAASFR